MGFSFEQVQAYLPGTRRGVFTLAGVAVLGLGLVAIVATRAKRAELPPVEQSRRVGALYYPTAKQWDALTIEPVSREIFRTEHVTEGKIGIDEDRATLVYSPYSGRITRLLAKPGDVVVAGQPLFLVEAPDMVQAQNDFINAVAGLNKANAQRELAEIIERQNKSLYETRAAPLRDVQQSQATASAAQNDVRAAQTALEVVRNRLRILGKTDEEIDKFSQTGDVSPQTTISSPIAGTVVQRKVGPGQYVSTSSNSPSANDAAYVIGDLSTVWLIAYIRETEASNVKVGQPLRFSVLGLPDRVFVANINYVATALDGVTRRLLVRATLDNSNRILRPEMFASVTVITGEGDTSFAVPRDAIIQDGESAHVWVANDNKSLESRDVKLGLSSGRLVQILSGLKDGDRIVSKGGLFVDRAASGSS